ncbi:MAG: EpsG family protein [Sphingomicrobium sp.]
MLPYWTLFVTLAVGGLFGQPNLSGTPPKRDYYFLLAMILIALMIGTRFQVGADWNAYRGMFTDAGRFSLSQQFNIGDPGYQALNWYIKRGGGELWMVNLVCGTLFAWGLYRLARAQPEPWLAALVAFPYLVVVVAMGYSRQGTAIGILMAALAGLSKGGSTTRFLLYVAVAASFHRTAVILVPLALFGAQKSRVVNLLLVLVFGYSIYITFLSNGLDNLVAEYSGTQFSSQGAAIRVSMIVIPAVIFFLAKGQMLFDPLEQRMWRNFSVASLITLMALLVLSSSSTAVDRVALYLLPLQIAIVSRVPVWGRANISMRVLVIVYSAAILFVWLNFADNSRSWVPYKSFMWS